jgi:hypothetical protein
VFVKNADLLVLEVIIKLTRTRIGGIGGISRWLDVQNKRGRGWRGKVWRETQETFLSHSATCCCIVELKEAVTLFPKLGFFEDFVTFEKIELKTVIIWEHYVGKEKKIQQN